jgi:hypothetical protein
MVVTTGYSMAFLTVLMLDVKASPKDAGLAAVRAD